MSVTDFLAGAGWGAAGRAPLASDASTRRYTRLSLGHETAILMEDPEGDVARFTDIARFLTDLGLSAPHILAEAPGLLLLEDLGDALFARLAEANPAREAQLYIAATDTLVTLHRAAPPALPKADPERLAAMTDLAFDWYLARATDSTDAQARAETEAALADALARHAPETDVTILRDFHAENLIWLPERHGPARVGLLDFQDALQGHRTYDLVSLLEDARRDVSETTREAAIRHYLEATGLARTPFLAACAVQGAARNLRILGVFARLAATRRKPHYVDLIPRVWAHLMRDLRHPVLTRLSALVHDALPPPNPAILDKLKTPCPTP